MSETSLLYFISPDPKRARGKSRREHVNIPPPHGRADNFMSIERVSWFITARLDPVYAPRTSSSSHFLTKIDAWKFRRALASRLFSQSAAWKREHVKYSQRNVCLWKTRGKKPVSYGGTKWLLTLFSTKTAIGVGIATLNTTSILNVLLLIHSKILSTK